MLAGDHFGRRRDGIVLFVIGVFAWTGALSRRLAELGVHAVMAGIALPNARSVAPHERFGMTKGAQFREVGFKFGRWIDVG